AGCRLPWRRRLSERASASRSCGCRLPGRLEAFLVREELPLRPPADAPGPLVSLAGLATARHGGSQDLVEKALEGAREPAAHIPVATDHRGDVGDLAGELEIQRRGVEDPPLPSIDQRELSLSAQ